jgi:hypothetical protein
MFFFYWTFFVDLSLDNKDSYLLLLLNQRKNGKTIHGVAIAVKSIQSILIKKKKKNFIY